MWFFVWRYRYRHVPDVRLAQFTKSKTAFAGIFFYLADDYKVKQVILTDKLSFYGILKA